MVECTSRNAFFEHHPVAGTYVAAAQRWGYNNLAEEAPRLALRLKRRNWYDCLDHPNNAESLTEMCVLAYAAQSKKDYLEHLPRHLLCFFEHLDTQFIWFFNEHPNDWLNFEFGSFRKRNLFRKITRKKSCTGCLKTDAEGFLQLLPLFLYSGRFNTPVVFLYAEGGPVPLVLFLCDDGNLHTSYVPKDKAAMTRAAAAAGLIIGDVYPICDQYHIHKLPVK